MLPKPKPGPAPALAVDDSNVAWTGMSIGAHKTRTVRVKLALDECAGDDRGTPSNKHNKMAKAHRELAFGVAANNGLYSAEIGIATFTGPVDAQQCLSFTIATVRERERAEVIVGWPAPKEGGGLRFPGRSDRFVAPHTDHGAAPQDRHRLPAALPRPV